MKLSEWWAIADQVDADVEAAAAKAYGDGCARANLRTVERSPQRTPLSADEVAAAVEMRAAGDSWTDVSIVLGCTVGTIQDAVRRSRGA